MALKRLTIDVEEELVNAVKKKIGKNQTMRDFVSKAMRRQLRLLNIPPGTEFYLKRPGEDAMLPVVFSDAVESVLKKEKFYRKTPEGEFIEVVFL